MAPGTLAAHADAPGREDLSPLQVLRRSPTPAAAGVAAVAAVTWVVTIERMRGMDAGPGTDLGGLGWFVGVWVTMMAAMMLPSVAPAALLVGRASAERLRARTFVPMWLFLIGYLASWLVYGLAAYGVFRLLRGAHWHAFSWSAQGPLIAGAAIAAAGVYELTPLKRMCLRHCRSPLHYATGAWRSARLGALKTGLEHGAFCVGCCWGLMLILFALGVMSITWMLVVAALIFAEKVLPHGYRLARLFAVAFVAVGIWVAAAPGTMPALTQPTSPAAAHMRMSGGSSMHMSRGSRMHPGSPAMPGMH